MHHNHQPIPLILPTPSGYHFARGIEHFLRTNYLPKRDEPVENANIWVPTKFRVFADTSPIVEIGQHVRGHNIFVIADVESQATVVPDFPRGVHTGHNLELLVDKYLVTDNDGRPLPQRSTKLAIDRNAMDVLRTVDAARWAGTAQAYITVVLPFYPYSRQDLRGKDDRQSLDMKLFTTFLQAAGANHIVTIDVHNPAALVNAVNQPMRADNLKATYTFLQTIRDNPHLYPVDNLCFVAPDQGSVDRNRVYADELKRYVSFVFKNRDRSRPNVVVGMFGFAGNPEFLRGADVVLVDDMADTVSTMGNATKYVREFGVKSITFIATHPVFSYPAYENLDQAYRQNLISRVYVTNSITLKQDDKEKYGAWLNVVDITKYFAKVIDQLSVNGSVSELLKDIR